MNKLIEKVRGSLYACNAIRGYLDDAGFPAGGNAHGQLAEIEAALTEAAAALEAAVSDVVWTPADDAAAAAAGWVVSNTSDGFDEIQRLDEAEVFHEDAAAIAHVYWMAGTGSELHRRAILYTLRDGNAWAYPP